MWPSRQKQIQRIETALWEFSNNEIPLLGIPDRQRTHTLALQMVASIRRLDYTQAQLKRPIDPRRADPNDPLFDPERAAIFHHKMGNIDEAVWLIFLATHFGKHGRHKWKRLIDVYSGLGKKTWTWVAVSADPPAFRAWLSKNESKIGGAFSNHRKYESLKTASNKGTASVIESYISWIGPSHRARFSQLVQAGGNNPHQIFDKFYNDMHIARFGRLGKFDFLAMLGRLDLAPIEPGSAYLDGATGPRKGVRLLIANDPDAAIDVPSMQDLLDKLDAALNVGMQVMEDALCNWQKSPSKFVHFLG
ncbi:hypothetical protein [Afipia broomeae]|uniref:Alpha-glutamyl/putrescinyl thymine pyrophosphorylase clade 3 domain-containing protein n=1 Tax=Afipia broomeae ATCC 49717 TaxID=883078 RepID=K8PGG5_9BRAD|nr:hypothetical protein [Afipia broomeae]EKS39844.1 hypothetical protein HMPREF9695_01805 [Afipia broomeae ATCC 49717]